jgi:hypothetical protein
VHDAVLADPAMWGYEALQGEDQKNRGWRQRHLRGLPNARAELLLIRIATNMAMIVRCRAAEVQALLST